MQIQNQKVKVALNLQDKINVKFSNEEITFSRKRLMQIKFCESKLNRWCNSNNDDKKNDEKEEMEISFIDFTSVYPKLTSKIFSLILEMHETLNKNSDQDDPQNMKNIQNAGNLLLSSNISVEELSLLVAAANFLLVTSISNDKLFLYFFQNHIPAIPVSKYNYFKKYKMKNNFVDHVIKNEMAQRNVMDNYLIHEIMYNRCNKLKSMNLSISSTPSPKFAAEYIVNQLKYELEREEFRHFVVYNRDDDNIVMGWEYEEKEAKLVDDIDYGILAAMNDFCEYIHLCDNQNIISFIQEYLEFIDRTFRFGTFSYGQVWDIDCYDNDDAYQQFSHRDGYDRSHFCFYGVGYIALKLVVLQCEDKLTVDFLNGISNSPRPGTYNTDFIEVYHKVIDHVTTNEDGVMAIRTLEKQRLVYGAKYQKKWNALFPKTTFPGCMRIAKLTVDDIEFLIQNVFPEIKQVEGIALLKQIFYVCFAKIDEITIPKSINDVFQKYLNTNIIQ